MSISDSLKELGRTAERYGAPLLGTVIAGPAGTAIGQIVAAQFGGDANDPDDLIKRIQSDPDAALKLTAIESSERVELERLSVDKKKAQLLDVEDARANNIRNTKLSDEIIKIYLVVSLSLMVFMCLYALIKGEVTGVEANIISGILGSSFTAVLAMVYFYWGNSVNERN